MTTTRRAWVDESGSDHAQDPGTYLLAAAIGHAEQETTTRDRMRTLRLPGQDKLHWRDEGSKRRTSIIQTLVDAPLEHLVVVRTGADGDRPERRRRKCLERLLHELELRQIADVVLESRGPADDRRDLEMLNALRGQRYLSSALRFSHVVGRHEPMLWVPDAICGAVTSARTGDGSHQEALHHRLVVIEI